VYRETGNEQAAARSAALLGRILIDGGRLKAAIEEMEAALAAIKDPADEVIASDLLANLSRAFMRSDQPGPSIEMADRALTVAERRNMERVVAEAMINKGSSLQTLSGRRREAAALLETAVGLAHESGWSEMELRGRNNLSVAVAEDDPRRALDIVLGGIALARRVGQRGIVNWQSGTSGMYSYVLGDGWDAALTLLDETVASAGLTASDKVRAITVSGVLRACRGEHVDDSVLDPDKSAAGESDPQTLDTAEHMRAIVALLGGRFDEAFSLASHSILGWRDFTPVHVPTAALAAFYAGRLDHAREAARLLNEFSSGGRWVVGLRAWATAGCEALEGNTAEAVKGLKGAIDELRAAEFHWFEALAILSAIRLLPGEPEVGGWAPAARAIFERVGAAPFIALLDKAVSDAAESAPRSGARTPAAKSAEVPAA
jgi:tetratricopeptide (TPR) repeat protein